MKRYDSLYHFRAFPFESYLNVLKTKNRKSHKPLKQLVKRLDEIENQVKGQCQNTHIAQDVRWTLILGPKIRLTSASSSDLKWTSIGCTFRYEEWTFMIKNQIDLKWTSIGCTIDKPLTLKPLTSLQIMDQIL